MAQKISGKCDKFFFDELSRTMTVECFLQPRPFRLFRFIYQNLKCPRDKVVLCGVFYQLKQGISKMDNNKEIFVGKKYFCDGNCAL